MNWPNHAIQAIHIRTDTVVAHASIITNLRLGMTDERVYGGIQNKIKGLPTIKQCKVLANRRNILTKYSNGTIAMFDVFTGEKGNALYTRSDLVSPPINSPLQIIRSNMTRDLTVSKKLDKVEVFESTDWEECLKQCEQLLYVPNWFSGGLI